MKKTLDTYGIVMADVLLKNNLDTKLFSAF